MQRILWKNHTTHRIKLTIKPRTSLTSVRCSKNNTNEMISLLKTAIENANIVCIDPVNSDTECMIMWDEVDEITKALHKTIENKKCDEEKDKKMVDNSWDVLMD